jgi:hypothetical protein
VVCSFLCVVLVCLLHHGVVAIFVRDRNDSSPLGNGFLKGTIDHQTAFVHVAIASNDGARLILVIIVVHFLRDGAPPPIDVETELAFGGRSEGNLLHRRRGTAIAIGTAFPQFRLHRPVPHKGSRRQPLDRLADRNRQSIDMDRMVCEIRLDAGHGLHGDPQGRRVSPKDPSVAGLGAPSRIAVPRPPDHPLGENRVGGRVAHVAIIVVGTGRHHGGSEGPDPKESPAGKKAVGTSLGVVGRVGGKQECLEAPAAGLGMGFVEGLGGVVGGLLGLALGVKQPKHVYRDVLNGPRVPALLNDIEHGVLVLRVLALVHEGCVVVVVVVAEIHDGCNAYLIFLEYSNGLQWNRMK